MGMLNAGQAVGSWLDKKFYKFFPPKGDGLDLDNVDVETGSGEVTDFRGMTDPEFLHTVKPDLKFLEKLRRVKHRIYKRRKKLAIPVCAVLLPITGYIDYLLL